MSMLLIWLIAALNAHLGNARMCQLPWGYVANAVFSREDCHGNDNYNDYAKDDCSE